MCRDDPAPPFLTARAHAAAALRAARSPRPRPPTRPQRYGVTAHRKISTATSSVGEIRMKENCEKLMNQLDADIRKLSLPEPIFIAE